ncbi:MAG: hypothetical protein IJ073_04310, partial [Lachnospiraceae bacterium]|nr:hypothetical protein [Lachnospiraceae bacterium]
HTVDHHLLFRIPIIVIIAVGLAHFSTLLFLCVYDNYHFIANDKTLCVLAFAAPDFGRVCSQIKMITL